MTFNFTASASLMVLALAACSQQASQDPQAGAAPQAIDPWFAGVDLAAYLDCTRTQGATLLQAHRAGDRPGAAENSIGAIEASLADGAVFIEIDVAQTADGVLVLMHDRTLERTTTGAGGVRDIPYTEFSGLRLRDVDGAVLDEAPPTLAAALEALDGRGVAQLDLKGVSVDTLATTLEEADAVGRAIVITYSLDDAIALHQRLPGVMLSASINDLSDLSTLDQAGVERSRITAWLGLGAGDPDLDAALASAGIETSFGDFRAEREGSIDYQRMAAAGAELISVDDMPAASDALDAVATARAILAACPAARS